MSDHLIVRETPEPGDGYDDSDVVIDSDNERAVGIGLGVGVGIGVGVGVAVGVGTMEDTEGEEEVCMLFLSLQSWQETSILNKLDVEQELKAPRRHPTTSKRKHSPSPSSTPGPSNTIAGHPKPHHHHDSSTVASPPHLLPHTLSHSPDFPIDFYSTRSYPINHLSYRYTPAGPYPLTQSLPIPFYKSIETYPQAVRWSWEDRSSFSFLSQDAKSITAEKGWRAARGNVPIREGNWYWEVKVLRGGGEGGREKGGVGEGSWVRVGVGRREAPLNAPVGVDGHSYAYRDRSGEAVTLALPRPYGSPYASGSTIGIYLSLPPRPSPSTSTSISDDPPPDLRDPHRIVRKRVPIRFKGQLFFESLEYAPSPEMEELAVDPATKKTKVALEKETKAAPGTKARPAPEDLRPPPREIPSLKGSKLAFFLDGVCQGVAFEDLYDFLPLKMDENGFFRRKGLDPTYKRMENWHDDGFLGYFPFVSVFGGGVASINPGPDFDFPPPDDIEEGLRGSPKPPISDPIEFNQESIKGRKWRPLCERYRENVAEQARLDESDRVQAEKNFKESLEKNRLLQRGLPSSTGTGGKGKKLKIGTTTTSSVAGASPSPSSPASSNLARFAITAIKGGTNLKFEDTPVGSEEDGEGEAEDEEERERGSTVIDDTPELEDRVKMEY